MHRHASRPLTALSLLAAALFAAPGGAVAEEAEFGLRSWGPRVGVAGDPDQVIAGIHWDVGQFRSQLRFVPNFQVGVGDDHTVVEGNAPVHWLFKDVDAPFTPYAGGGLAVAWIDRDLPPQARGDDSDVDLNLKAIGGLEWRLRSSNFFTELALVFGDPHDFQIVAGWSFRTRRGGSAP